MKYWSYFTAKLAAAGMLVFVVKSAIRWSFPRRTTIFHSQQDLFAHDLAYTTVMMLFFLFCIGLLYLLAHLGYEISEDEKYRHLAITESLRGEATLQGHVVADADHLQGWPAGAVDDRRAPEEQDQGLHREDAKRHPRADPAPRRLGGRGSRRIHDPLLTADTPPTSRGHDSCSA